MKKRVLAMLLSVTMVASMLAGCGGSNQPAESGTASADTSGGSDSTAPDDSAAASDDSASEASGEKVKLKAVAVIHPLTKDPADMQWLHELETEANVEVEWEVIRADWDTVKSTRFAAGDIPDILLCNATNDDDYVKYNGLFLELTPYLTEELTPNISAMFAEEPDTKALVTTKDGKIYGTPKFQGKWPSTNSVMFINQKWLDNLGLSIPTTFTELKDVLMAFKEQDANGNGDPNDEIPLDFNGSGGINSWFNSAYSLTSLIGGLGIQVTNTDNAGFFAEDNTVKCYAVDERYKLFMKYIADLYANGLINENALTNDYSTFQSLSRGNEAGEAIVGCVLGWEQTDKFGPELHTEYAVVPPLAYDVNCEPGTYDTRWRNDYTILNMQGNRACISAKCANPEAALRFIDRFYDQTHSVEGLFGGVADGCIEKTGDNSYKVLPPQDPNTDAGTWKWTSTFADWSPMYIRRATEIEMAQDMTYALDARAQGYNEVIEKAGTSDTYPAMFMRYTEEDQNTLALTKPNIDYIIDNQWSLWMTGEQDINSTWDTYVESVNNAGLPQILEIRQAAFDEYLKSVQ